jgi:hypothetical protein
MAGGGMSYFQYHRAALIAANQASQASASILLSLTEAENATDVVLDPEAEVPQKLAEALILSIELTDPGFVDDDMRQILGACRRFVEGWAG